MSCTPEAKERGNSPNTQCSAQRKARQPERVKALDAGINRQTTGRRTVHTAQHANTATAANLTCREAQPCHSVWHQGQGITSTTQTPLAAARQYITALTHRKSHHITTQYNHHHIRQYRSHHITAGSTDPITSQAVHMQVSYLTPAPGPAALPPVHCRGCTGW